MTKKRLIEHDLFGTEPKAKGINSKDKGDRNETALCKWLYKWTGQRFIRVPSSGGRRLVNNSSFCADVVCENEDFNFAFAIETKHYANFGFKKGKLAKNSKVLRIWSDQVVPDAKRAKKIPIMALRENYMKANTWLIFTDTKLQGIEPILMADNKEGLILYAYSSEGFLSYEDAKLQLSK